MILPSSFFPFLCFAKFFFVLSFAVNLFLPVIIPTLNSLLLLSFPYCLLPYYFTLTHVIHILSFHIFLFLLHPFFIHHIVPCPVLYSLHLLSFPVHLLLCSPCQYLSPFLLISPSFSLPSLYEFPCLFLPSFPGNLSN